MREREHFRDFLKEEEPKTEPKLETLELTPEEENQIKQELIDQLNQETVKKVDEAIKVIKNDPEASTLLNREAPKDRPGRLKKILALALSLILTGGPAGYFLRQKSEKVNKEPKKLDTRSRGRDAQAASRKILESRDDTQAGKERRFKEREERLMSYTHMDPNTSDYSAKAERLDNELKLIWAKPLDQLTPAEKALLLIESKSQYIIPDARYKTTNSTAKLEAYNAYKQFIDSGGKDRPSPPPHDGDTIGDLWMQNEGYAGYNPYWPDYDNISITASANRDDILEILHAASGKTAEKALTAKADELVRAGKAFKVKMPDGTTKYSITSKNRTV